MESTSAAELADLRHADGALLRREEVDPELLRELRTLGAAGRPKRRSCADKALA